MECTMDIGYRMKHGYWIWNESWILNMEWNMDIEYGMKHGYWIWNDTWILNITTSVNSGYISHESRYPKSFLARTGNGISTSLSASLVYLTNNIFLCFFLKRQYKLFIIIQIIQNGVKHFEKCDIVKIVAYPSD